MKIRYMSDLHLNVGAYTVPDMEGDNETILVLAGDVCEVAHGKEQYRKFFEDVCEHFKLVIYVFGNHEHYDGSILRTHEKFMRECGHIDKLKVLDYDTIEVDNVRFIGGTLWTDIDNENELSMFDAKRGMNDYFSIRTGTITAPYFRRFEPIDSIGIHKKYRPWLFEQVIDAKLKGMKTVVVTHHHPSFKSVPEKYKHDGLNGNYCTEMFDEVFEHGPDFWICGHIHTKTDYMINQTNVLCNPRGYHTRDWAELGTGFDPEAMIEI